MKISGKRTFHCFKISGKRTFYCFGTAGIMMETVFRRKSYDRMLEWKNRSNGKSALLIEGARRVGKSTIAELFAKNEYSRHIYIDFSKHDSRITDLFEDLSDMDRLFRGLQLYTGVYRTFCGPVFETAGNRTGTRHPPSDIWHNVDHDGVRRSCPFRIPAYELHLVLCGIMKHFSV